MALEFNLEDRYLSLYDFIAQEPELRLIEQYVFDSAPSGKDYNLNCHRDEIIEWWDIYDVCKKEQQGLIGIGARNPNLASIQAEKKWEQLLFRQYWPYDY